MLADARFADFESRLADALAGETPARAARRRTAAAVPDVGALTTQGFFTKVCKQQSRRSLAVLESTFDLIHNNVENPDSWYAAGAKRASPVGGGGGLGSLARTTTF